MKLVIQRVSAARVEIDGRLISNIGKGLLILVGIHKNDDGSQIEWLANKVANLRIFSDNTGKMNLSVKDVSGEILLVSQFTLYGNSNKGRRPDFTSAARPEKAEELYRKFAAKLKEIGLITKLGSFGAYMKVSLENDGPVTIILER